GGHRPAVRELAHGVLRRHPACPGDTVDPEPGSGITDVGGRSPRGERVRAYRQRTARRGTWNHCAHFAATICAADACATVRQLFRHVRLVATVHLDTRVLVSTGRSRQTRL